MNVLGYSFTGTHIQRGLVKGAAVAALICATIFVQLRITNPLVIPELRLSTWLLVPTIFIVTFVLRESRSDSDDLLFANQQEIVRTLGEIALAVVIAFFVTFSLRSVDW